MKVIVYLAGKQHGLSAIDASKPIELEVAPGSFVVLVPVDIWYDPTGVRRQLSYFTPVPRVGRHFDPSKIERYVVVGESHPVPQSGRPFHRGYVTFLLVAPFSFVVVSSPVREDAPEKTLAIEVRSEWADLHAFRQYLREEELSFLCEQIAASSTKPSDEGEEPPQKTPDSN